MRIFHSPAVVAPLMVAAAGAQAVTGIIESQAQAADLKAQAEAERIARRRELRDEREENRRQLARTRALLSAGGTDIGTILSLSGAQAGESAIRQHRIRSDSRLRERGLRTRAGNVRRAGFFRAGSSLLSGGAGIAKFRAGRT